MSGSIVEPWVLVADAAGRVVSPSARRELALEAEQRLLPLARRAKQDPLGLDRPVLALWALWVAAWQDSAPDGAPASRRRAVLGIGAADRLVRVDAILRGMGPEVRHSLVDSAQASAAILARAARGEG